MKPIIKILNDEKYRESVDNLGSNIQCIDLEFSPGKLVRVHTISEDPKIYATHISSAEWILNNLDKK